MSPRRSLRPCSYPGCGVLVDKGKCEAHQTKQKEQQRQSDRQRAKPFLHLYGTQWKKLRAVLLREQPLCVECQKTGRVVAATVVDHIIPHKGDLRLFYDQANLQNLCTTCHNVKTASEDGGWSNPTGKARVR